MIIFLNGTISSGKSTIARLLATKIPNTANLEIDSLRDFIAFMPLEEAISINLDNAVLIIRNLVKYKINVVVPYPLSENNYLFLSEKLSDLGQNIFVFTITPTMDSLLKGDRVRKLDEWEIGRIKHHYKTGLTSPKFGKIIDNTDQTPEETANLIAKEVME